jgi:hypothetical protein
MNDIAATKLTSADVNSESVGDDARFRTFGDLERELHELPPSPTDEGRVALIVRRVAAGGRREILDAVELTADSGVPGDAWERRPQKDAEMQIAVMQIDVARLIANGQPLTLFGDNLFVELDLRASNLPPGTRVSAGSALLEITPMPHNGCRKFQSRFGADALRLVAGKDLRHRNLRGIYMRVVQPGVVRPGDSIQVLSRARP